MTCDGVRHVEVRLAFVAVAEQPDLHQAAVLVQRYAAVIQQVAVVHAVHAAVVVQEGDVHIQPSAARERSFQLAYHSLFVLSQFVRILRVESGEGAFVELVHLAADVDCSGIDVYLFQHQAVVHPIVGVALYDLTLQLELHEGDRCQSRIHRSAVGIIALGEEDEIPQADAVAILERPHCAVFDAVAHDVRDTRLAAACRAHPQDVMVAPFDVERVVLHQQVDDLIRSVAAVEDIADNVESVYCQPLYQTREREDEVVRAHADDGVEDVLMVAYLVVVLVLLRVEKLVDDVGVVVRGRFTHL